MEDQSPRITATFGKDGWWHGALLGLLLTGPSFIWICLDTHAWGGDQSQYGRATLELFRALTDSPQAWVSRLLDNFPSKPNGLIWIGQLFVPLGEVMRMDTALLFAVAGIQTLTFVLVHRSIQESTPAVERPARVIACLVIASAPLFVFLGHQYLVETLQTLSVAWFILILSRSPGWSRTQLVGQLVAASGFALATKASQPLFCALPALAAAGFVFRRKTVALPAPASRVGEFLSYGFGVPFGLLTVVWYHRNWTRVIEHVRAGTSGPGVKTFWGREDSYFNTVGYWLGAVRFSFFFPATFVLVLVVLLIGLGKRLATVDGRRRHATFCAAIAALQVVMVVLVFSLSPARPPRYLLPVLPYVALLVAWSVSRIGRRPVTVIVAAAFFVQFLLVHGQALALLPFRSWIVRSYERNAMSSRILESIVERTCVPDSNGPFANTLAIDPSLHGDWLAPEPANYAVAKSSWRRRIDVPCTYYYVGEDFFGDRVDRAWQEVLSRNVRYFITTDPARYPTGPVVYNQVLSRENFPLLLQRLKSSGSFEAEAPLDVDPGIVVFRRRTTTPGGNELESPASHPISR